MSGFALKWLDLREPADCVARNPGLLRAAAVWLTRQEGEVLDLGCGSGATWRALAPHLGQPRQWRLLDNDTCLLEAAAHRTSGEVTTILADLRELEAVPLAGVRLITATALLDLVSEVWARNLARRLAEARSGLYAALNYDGMMTWSEPHPLDDAVLAAFNEHQASDKGFGPALGPKAWRIMGEALRELGYRVKTAPSPWSLDGGSSVLGSALLEGVAEAATEMGLDTHAWLEARLQSVGGEVGHVDLLALPPDQAGG